MTRRLTVTAAEWASVQDGSLWLVREGDIYWFGTSEHDHRPTPPAEFVQACAPCPNLVHRDGGFIDQYGEFTAVSSVNCLDCRIELVAPCPYERDHTWLTDCVNCSNNGTITLGYAYAIGQPLPIIKHHAWEDVLDDGNVVVVDPTNRPWFVPMKGGSTDLTAALAHYGDPSSLFGKWATQLTVVGP